MSVMLNDPILEAVSPVLHYTLSRLQENLRAGHSRDVSSRRFVAGGFDCALLYLDGMVDVTFMGQNLLTPAMEAAPFDGLPEARPDWLVKTVLSAASVAPIAEMDMLVARILTGDTALVIDGASTALIVETKGFAHRAVTNPVNETVVLGPHEAFVEHLKTNQVLLRRIIKSPRLVQEAFTIGTTMPTDGVMIYLDGIANAKMVETLRGRIHSLMVDHIPSVGALEQWLEDSPFSLVPQTLRTERPDRAASFIMEGMIVVLVDGAPLSMAMPATIWHMLHTSDTSFMRFPIANFLRGVSFLGMLTMLFLPALFLSVVNFHNDALPLGLIISIYETQSKVPIPIFFSLLFMGFAFDLINEAGARMPGTLAQGLGVVSALIVGQAAVAADLVSPLMIIIVALSGLGSLVIPDYSLALGLRIAQSFLLLAAAVGGLFGVLLMVLLLLTALSMQTSLGVPLLAPVAPKREHNQDIVTRAPIFWQRLRAYWSQHD